MSPSAPAEQAGNGATPRLRELQVRGPFKGPSGYDHHTREFVRELDRQGVRVELLELQGWSATPLPVQLRDPWFETLQRPVGARVALQFCMPHQLEFHDDMLDVNYTMFEATRVSPAWVEQNRRCDLLIVPTESSRRAWIASGMPRDRIAICPMGIDPARFEQPGPPLALRLENGTSVSQFRTRFLNISEVSPRKNLVGLLRTWVRATTRADDAVLILKLGGYSPSWLDVFKRQVEALDEQLGKRLDEAAPIRFVYDLYSDGQMPSLFAAATHYISLSHGEGWDQVMVEAAASGLKLIAPNHSAYTAYLDASTARLIGSREVPTSWPGDPATAALFEGATWWAPDEDEAAGFLREAIEGRDGGVGSARERILRDLTWDHATRRLIAILGDLETTSTHRAR